MTSHDVVAICRRSFGTKKIGHSGTLDPMATGLLILVLGKATKLQDKFMAERKQYVGTLKLGEVTDSYDAMGSITATTPLPADLGAEQIEQAFAKYKGAFQQIPPMVSAIKMGGVALYKLARKGQEVERPPRDVSIYDSRITRINLPEVEFVVDCSKGFYVRSYAFDIGNDLGVGAHLSALQRTRIGDFSVENAISIADLKTLPREELLQKLIPLEQLSAYTKA